MSRMVIKINKIREGQTLREGREMINGNWNRRRWSRLDVRRGNQGGAHGKKGSKR